MGFLEVLYIIVPIALAYSAPLIIAALGGIFSERSGVVNIALEGLMVMGAFSGIVSALTLSKMGLGCGKSMACDADCNRRRRRLLAVPRDSSDFIPGRPNGSWSSDQHVGSRSCDFPCPRLV